MASAVRSSPPRIATIMRVNGASLAGAVLEPRALLRLPGPVPPMRLAACLGSVGSHPAATYEVLEHGFLQQIRGQHALAQDEVVEGLAIEPIAEL